MLSAVVPAVQVGKALALAGQELAEAVKMEEVLRAINSEPEGAVPRPAAVGVHRC